MRTFLCQLAVFAFIGASIAFAHDEDKKSIAHGGSPQPHGSALVFSGTGWYRHPETASVNGWLARLSDDLGMRVDVSETPKDLQTILGHYQVLVMNNCNELTTLMDAGQLKAVEDRYNKGGGIAALHAALVHQTKWTWFSELAGCDFDSDSEHLEAKSASILPQRIIPR